MARLVSLLQVAGCIARARGLQARYQSNACRTRESLSIGTLGWMALADDAIRFAKRQLDNAIRRLSEPPLLPDLLHTSYG